MKESIVFWKEYLKQYSSTEGFTGLTIPNIIGSVRINTSYESYSIGDFLDEVLNENFEILISFCTDEDELVFGYFKPWNFYKKGYDKIGSIHFNKSDFSLPVNTLGQLKNQLEKKYKCRINLGTFSKVNNSNKWIYLTDEDIFRHSKVMTTLKSK
jgi:hypothetical protein